MLYLLDLAACGGSNVADVGQGVEHIGFIAAIGLLIEVIEDILRDLRDALRRHISAFTVDIPNLFVRHVVILVHRLDVIHAERQNVFVVDCVYDGIGVQPVAKRLLGRNEGRFTSAGEDRRAVCAANDAFALRLSGVGGENRRTREAEKVIMLEASFDGSVHIAKLTAVALVEDHHDMLIVDRMFGCTADER